MIAKGSMIIKLMQMIDREKANSRRYCEINPADAERRKQMEQTVISTLLEVMTMVTE